MVWLVLLVLVGIVTGSFGITYIAKLQEELKKSEDLVQRMRAAFDDQEKRIAALKKRMENPGAQDDVKNPVDQAV